VNAINDLKPVTKELSVVIPTYNRCDILKKCLEALNKQTHPFEKFEVVVCDDGSTDNTASMVKEFQEHANYDLLYVHQTNKGPAAAKNTGVLHSSGRIVLFFNDDTIAAEDLLEMHMKFHADEDNKNKALLGHMDWHPDLKINKFMKFIMKEGFQFGYDFLSHNQVVPYKNFYTCNVSLERKWFKDDEFDAHFKTAAFEDLDYGHRIIKKGLKVVYWKTAVGYHHHQMDKESFIKRHRKVGKASVYFFSKHPELRRNNEFLFFDSELKDHRITGDSSKDYYELLYYYYDLGIIEGIIQNSDDVSKDFINWLYLKYRYPPNPEPHYSPTITQSIKIGIFTIVRRFARTMTRNKHIDQWYRKVRSPLRVEKLKRYFLK